MTDINRLLASLKRRSAHVKEFGDDITFVKLEDLDALVEALEKAQAAERRWHRVASRIHEQACESDVKIDELEAIRAAAEKLVRCKGRYHSELNYRALAALFGVTTPNLPPLEHENVHYADAAEMEIAALRQRIAELEREVIRLQSLKTVNAALQEAQSEFHRGYSCGHKDALLESRTLKLPDFRHERFNSDWGEHDAEAYQVALRETLIAAGIKVETE